MSLRAMTPGNSHCVPTALLFLALRLLVELDRRRVKERTNTDDFDLDVQVRLHDLPNGLGEGVPEGQGPRFTDERPELRDLAAPAPTLRASGSLLRLRAYG